MVTSTVGSRGCQMHPWSLPILCSARAFPSCAIQNTTHTGLHRFAIKTTPRDRPTGQPDTNNSSMEIFFPGESRSYWELKVTKYCLFGFVLFSLPFPPLCSRQIPKYHAGQYLTALFPGCRMKATKGKHSRQRQQSGALLLVRAEKGARR